MTLRCATIAFLFLGSFAAPACAAPAPQAGSRCEVTDLNQVFADPIAFTGKRFCGEALGVRDGARISFYPPGYNYSDHPYDRIASLDDRGRRRLMLRHRRPFTIRMEAIVEPRADCFTPGSDLPRCTPFHYPIILRALSLEAARGPAVTAPASLFSDAQ